VTEITLLGKPPFCSGLLKEKMTVTKVYFPELVLGGTYVQLLLIRRPELNPSEYENIIKKI